MIAVLEKLGFSFARQAGSHAIYKNTIGLRTTIPIHGGKILHPKTVKTILRDTNISVDEFINLL